MSDFEEAIVEMENFVVLLSAASTGNDTFVVNAERALAHKYGKRIIPVLLGDSDDAIAAIRVPEDIRHLPCLRYATPVENEAGQFTVPAECPRLLCAALDERREHIEQHTMLCVRSWRWEKQARPHGLLLPPKESERALKLMKEAERKSYQPAYSALIKEYVQVSTNTHECGVQ